ncbi:hypothetical protein AB4Z48_23125 [Cupriavidus sp. 2TAF22]|uniref:hypothetical protein n=1 Tax=unclassified Cupriavidus TaxID=2640874 RepID=UPI003F9186E7
MRRISRWVSAARWLLTLALGFVCAIMIAELWAAASAPAHADSAQGPFAELRAYRAREYYAAACAFVFAAALSALWALWAASRDPWLRYLAGAPILAIWVLSILNRAG